MIKQRFDKLKEKFLKHGLVDFSEIHVLELALCLASGSSDENATANRLINRFGSLNGVVEAHLDKISEIDDKNGLFLNFLREFVTYIGHLKSNPQIIKSTAQATEHLNAVLQTYSEEVFMLLCLDMQGKIVLQEGLRGALDHVWVDIRSVVDSILRVKAASVIFAHNHLDGHTTPSDADISLTRTAVNLLTPLGIDLVDHIIVGSGEPYSFASQGLLDVLKREQDDFSKSRGYEILLRQQKGVNN